MFKKVVTVVGAAVVVAALGLFAVGAVSAGEPAPTPDGKAPRGGPWGHMGRGVGIVSDAVTELLGMTRQEVHEERVAGKTLAQIAQEKGVTDQQVIDALLAGRQEAIDQAVKEGKLTQEQADWLLARAKAMAPFELSNPFAPPAGRGGMHGEMRGEGRGERRGERRGEMRGERRGGHGPCCPHPDAPEPEASDS